MGGSGDIGWLSCHKLEGTGQVETFKECLYDLGGLEDADVENSESKEDYVFSYSNKLFDVLINEYCDIPKLPDIAGCCSACKSRDRGYTSSSSLNFSESQLVFESNIDYTAKKLQLLDSLDLNHMKEYV